MSKWNKIEDGMPPETEKCYLVYCKDIRCQFTALVDENTKELQQWCDGRCDKPFGYEITHWREMPKNPKE